MSIESITKFKFNGVEYATREEAEEAAAVAQIKPALDAFVEGADFEYDGEYDHYYVSKQNMVDWLASYRAELLAALTPPKRERKPRLDKGGLDARNS